jgi:hypothetical protein
VFGRLLRRRMVSMNAAASLFHKVRCVAFVASVGRLGTNG